MYMYVWPWDLLVSQARRESLAHKTRDLLAVSSFSPTHMYIHTPTQHTAMPFTCLICNQTGGKRSNVHSIDFHQSLNHNGQVTLGLSESDTADRHRICSQHYRNGDSSQVNKQNILKKRFSALLLLHTLHLAVLRKAFGQFCESCWL